MEKKDFKEALIYACIITAVVLIGLLLTISYISDKKVDNLKNNDVASMVIYIYNPFFSLYSGYDEKTQNILRGMYLEGIIDPEYILHNLRDEIDIRDSRLKKLRSLDKPDIITVECVDIECTIIKEAKSLLKPMLVDISIKCSEIEGLKRCDYQISKSLSQPNKDLFKIGSELYDDRLEITRDIDSSMKDIFGEVISFEQKLDEEKLDFWEKITGKAEDLSVEALDLTLRFTYEISFYSQIKDYYDAELIDLIYFKDKGFTFSDGTADIDEHISLLEADIKRLKPLFKEQQEAQEFSSSINLVGQFNEEGFIRSRSMMMLDKTKTIQATQLILDNIAYEYRSKMIDERYQGGIGESKESKAVRLRIIRDYMAHYISANDEEIQPEVKESAKMLKKDDCIWKNDFEQTELPFNSKLRIMEDEGDKSMTVNSGSEYTALGNNIWQDYQAELDVKPYEKQFIIYSRMSGQQGGYGIRLESDKVVLWRDHYELGEDLSSKSFDFNEDRYYSIRISHKGNTIKVYVDDKILIAYTDDSEDKIAKGNFGVEFFDKAMIDDVLIKGQCN